MHETRPHVVPTEGDLTPGISAAEYYARRLALAKEMPVHSVAVLVGNQVQHSSGSVFYEFQQDTDLYYLTGWLGPDSVALVEKVADKGTDEDVVFHLVVPPKNPATDLWEGDKNGMEGAVDYFNADEVGSIHNMELYLQKVLQRNQTVFYDGGAAGAGAGGPGARLRFSQFFGLSLALRRSGISELVGRKPVRPLRLLLAQHRAVKSDAEVGVMHAAGRISSRAINTAIARVGLAAPFQSEKMLAQYLEYAFVWGGCDAHAYIPVVASGENALALHYTRNDDLLYRDETVFVDAGGILGGYRADILRAWPNGPQGFLDPQRDIYSVVLEANKACVAAVEPGELLQNLHELAVTVLVQGLRNLPGFAGVSRADVSRTLFPHYIGHHLGLDLHDVPGISRSAKLCPGNVVTIEPGLYVPQEDKWPVHYRGIGMRVEDDVAVGALKAETLNMTSLCVKEVADIEALIRAGTATTPGIYDENPQPL